MLGKQNSKSEDICVQISMTILDKVERINITPKLSIYNRTYYNKYKFNRRVRSATKEIEKEIKKSLIW